MIIGIGRFELPNILRNILFSIRLLQNSKILLVFRAENFSGFNGIGIGIRLRKRNRDRVWKELFFGIGVGIEKRNRSRD